MLVYQSIQDGVKAIKITLTKTIYCGIADLKPHIKRTSMKDRRKALVVSSLVADSLALGAHWIYDTEKIRKEFGRVDRLLKPSPGSYHSTKERGEFTHYGDQAMVLIESVAARGGFEVEDFSNRWRALFSDYKGYIDQATQATLQNYGEGKKAPEAGSSSSELAGASRIAPLVCRYAQDLDTLLGAARDQTRMTHQYPLVVDGAEFFSRVCWKILLGDSPLPAIEDVVNTRYKGSPLHEWARRGLESRGEDSVEVIKRFGQSCRVDEAFSGVIHLIVKYENNLKEALIQNVMAGGDSAGRGMMVGMVLGAYLGTEIVPSEWVSGLKRKKDIFSLIKKIS
jgi:ADP-ribosylglycohydrolase